MKEAHKVCRFSMNCHMVISVVLLVYGEAHELNGRDGLVESEFYGGVHAVHELKNFVQLLQGTLESKKYVVYESFVKGYFVVEFTCYCGIQFSHNQVGVWRCHSCSHGRS